MDLADWLWAEHQSFTPEAKLLWLRLGHRYGVHKWVCENTKTLAKGLGFGERTLSRALSDLRAVQGIEGKPDYWLLQTRLETKGSGSGRGRPKSALMVAPWEPGGNSGQLLDCHRGIVQQILFAGRTQGFDSRGSELSQANRLTLAVLVSLANPCGEIRGVPKSRLCLMTGMARERLDNQLKKLCKLGYMYGWVGGGTGKYILGMRFGVYWVNLKKCGEVFDKSFRPPLEHKFFFNAYDLGVALLGASVPQGCFPALGESGTIRESPVWSFKDRRFKGICRLFDDEPDDRLSSILQQELETAALWVAKQFLVLGPSFSPDSLETSFADRYQEMFLSSAGLEKLKPAREGSARLFISYIFSLCSDLAIRVIGAVEACVGDRRMDKSLTLSMARCSGKSPERRVLLVSTPDELSPAPSRGQEA